MSNPDYEITGVYLTGYASPEGLYTRNEILSRDRTVALKDYLRRRINFRQTFTMWIGKEKTGSN